MTPEEKEKARQTLIDGTFKELGRTNAAVHVIAENWSGVENKRLTIENRDLKLEVEKLKTKKK